MHAFRFRDVFTPDETTLQPCYRALLVAVEYHEGRWSEPAIAAAAAMPNRDAMTPQDWAELLDRIDLALRAVLPEAPVSCVMRRAIRTGN